MIVLTLYRLFRRITGHGSAEAKAAKWDRTADRMGRQREDALMLFHLAVRRGASQDVIDDLATDVRQYMQAERNARIVAAEIRAGR